jgi:hypothetical protein
MPRESHAKEKAVSSTSIRYTTELMTNFAQAEIMCPEAEIIALQASHGEALLFSISTEGSLYVTVESTGTRSGWKRANLSAAQVVKDFAQDKKARCVHFAASQCGNGTIHLALVVRTNGNDHLYLSLGNKDADLSWIDAPVWTSVPYDDKSHVRSSLTISDVFISDASDAEYIVVDVVRDPASATSLIYRYYIDSTRANGSAWQPHDVAADIQTEKYKSTLARKTCQGTYAVDGIVTCGQINGVAQLMYSPLYNVFDPSIPPSPDILHLPEGTIAESVAACRNADNSADLYVISGGALYWFASDNQENGATGVLVVQNDLFIGVRTLFAFLASSTQVVVWGLNSSNEIFYITCSLGRQTERSAWSNPVPILSGVEQLAPFANRTYSANCFFAHTGQNKLVKAVKSPGTLMWTFQSITLPALTKSTPAQSLDSYTTQIQVTNDNGLPASNAEIRLSSTNVVAVTINHHYCILSSMPIIVTADALGCITVVEPVDSIQGSRLTVEIGNTSVQINPMNKPFQQSVTLDTVDKLRSATIHYQDGGSKSLAHAETAHADLVAVASMNARLATTYQALASPTDTPPVALFADATTNLGTNCTLIDCGDFFSWLISRIDQGFQDAVSFIEDTATKIWKMVVVIAGKAYHAILNTVEAVVKATIWIYDQIKIAAKDVIDFLKFLFDLEDLKRTKAVLKNTVKLLLQNEVKQIETIRHDLKSAITTAENIVNQWAGLKPWSELGPDANATVSSKSSGTIHQSAPGNLLQHHFEGNAQDHTFLSPLPQQSQATSDVFDALIQAIENEDSSIKSSIDNIQSLAKDFSSLSLQDALEKLLAIVVDFGLNTFENVADAVLNLLCALAESALERFDIPIHIPVLSDVLNSFGVLDFSFLDAVCWVMAVPANLLYKSMFNATPFPENEDTKLIIAAKSWEDLCAAFSLSLQPVKHSSVRSIMAKPKAEAEDHTFKVDGLLTGLPDKIRHTVSLILQFVADFCTFTSAILCGYEATELSGDNKFSIPSAIVNVIGAVTNGFAFSLVLYDPIECEGIVEISLMITVVRIMSKVIFSTPGLAVFKKCSPPGSFLVDDPRGVGAIFDAVFILPELIVSIWHFTELGKKPASRTRSIAIIQEVGSMTSYISRISYTVAVNTKDLKRKAEAILSMTIANVTTGGLQLANAITVAAG